VTLLPTLAKTEVVLMKLIQRYYVPVPEGISNEKKSHYYGEDYGTPT